MTHALITVAFPLLMFYAAVTDLLAKIIPNRACLLLVLLYPVAAAGAGLPLPVIGMSFAAAAIVFGLGLIPYSLGQMGAGDVKLATAGALWLGWQNGVMFVALTTIYGGLLSLGILMLAYQVRLVPQLRLGFLADINTRNSVPYGVAIAAAAMHVYPDSPLWQLVL